MNISASIFCEQIALRYRMGEHFCAILVDAGAGDHVDIYVDKQHAEKIERAVEAFNSIMCGGSAESIDLRNIAHPETI